MGSETEDMLIELDQHEPIVEPPSEQLPPEIYAVLVSESNLSKQENPESPILELKTSNAGMTETDEEEPMRPMKTDIRDAPRSLVLSTSLRSQEDSCFSDEDSEKDEVSPLKSEHVSHFHFHFAYNHSFYAERN